MLMTFRLSAPKLWLAGWLVACVAGQAVAAGPKIYILTDLEGVSGVYKFSQARDKETPLGQKAMEYLMGDVAAVVRGLRDAGAGEIVVLDGHGTQAFVPHLMEPGAKYVTKAKWNSKFADVPGLEKVYDVDASYAGVVQLGAHAMMGTPDGVLNHTQSSEAENRYWYNGVESGELAQMGIYAGHFGVPIIMVTGDVATCREARKFFGEPCVTVAVKQGIGREAAVLYPFAETRRALYEGAKRAIAAITKCKPYKVKLPIQAKREHLVFEGPEKKPRLVTTEKTIPNGLHIGDL
jgi:D-amino peptidase